MRYELKQNSWQGQWHTLNQDHLLHAYSIPLFSDLQYSVQSNPYSNIYQAKTSDETTDDNNSDNTGDENTSNNTEDDNAQTKTIIFFSNGELTPFTITIGVKNKPPIYKIVGKANGSIRLTTLGK
jgi:hypothetical protein